MVLPTGGGGNMAPLPLAEKRSLSLGVLTLDKDTAEVVWNGPSGIELRSSWVISRGFKRTRLFEDIIEMLRACLVLYEWMGITPETGLCACLLLMLFST